MTNEMQTRNTVGQLSLSDLGYVLAVTTQLKKISKSLNTLGIYDCNYGLTEKQERRVVKLVQKANELASYIGYKVYHQGDPRGCSLYLVDGTCANGQYTNGIALC